MIKTLIIIYIISFIICAFCVLVAGHEDDEELNKFIDSRFIDFALVVIPIVNTFCVFYVVYRFITDDSKE